MQPKEFNLCTSNIFGRYLIEASAGTGKTYSLEHLVLRFIVEAKVEVDRILIVTFTKAATAEIKERVRKVLQRMSKALTNGEELKDKTEAAMVEMWTKDGRDALDLINRALEAFDDASVQTIHSFCQKMLTEFNFTRAGAYDVTVTADTGLSEAVIDEFLRTETAKLSPEDAQVVLNWDCFPTILSKLSEAGDTIDIKELPELVALDNPEDALGETDKKPDDKKPVLTREQLEVLKRFVELAPKRLEALEKEAGVMSFSSLLVQMYRLVMTKPDLVQKIRHRFDAVLIDEFQDTDSIQYGIFKTLFLPENRQEGPKSVFFVGDPKQAIYGFRMAELSTYLKARQELLDADPESVLELKKNFRSTPALVATINAVFSGGSASHFLNDELSFSSADYGSSAAPLVRRIGNVLYPIPTVSFWLHPGGDKLNADGARQLQADRLAQDIANLLADDNVYIKRDTVVDGVRRKYRLLRAGDIALLVRKRTNADIIIDALAKRGIRAAVSGAGDVFQTPEALEVAAILSAMDDPLNRKLLNTARATRLWGRTMREIRDMADTQGVSDRQLLVECGKRFVMAGPSAALNFLQDTVQTAERLLSVNQGFAILENYAHIIELLQAQFARLKTLGAVLRWFESQIAAGSAGDDDRKLRSVIDDNVVKIETVHSSKGLEYPLVYIPWASDMTANSKDKSVFFQEDVEDNGRILKKALIFSTAQNVSDHEPTKARDTEERVRLAYVAMTRASSRLVVSLTHADSSAKTNLTNGYVQGMMAVRKFEQTGKDIVPLIKARLDEIQKEVCSRDWTDTVNPDDFGEGLVLSDD
ncbi:MAG: UvrD-helicase domain-containing protein, partial [Sutterellaceae bacterium]|nr:UvrD-helicase domain-containing protein [Sutterellaceae bacterium]